MSNRLRGRFPNRSSNRVPSWVLTAGGVPASLDIDFVNDRAYSASPSSIPILLSCTRASSGYYLNADGTLTQFSDGQLRYGTNGLLVEEQRINLAKWSQAYDTATSGATWTKANSSVSANETAPDGTLTAYKIIEDSTAAAFHGISQSITTTTATVVTASAYLKAGTRSWAYLVEGNGVSAIAYFNLSNGTVGTVSGTGSPSAAIKALANGWYLCSVTYTTASTTPNLQIRTTTADNTYTYNGDGSSYIYAWGAQFEVGAYVTSYIPTSSGAAQRNSDDIAFANISWYNQAAGTLYAACLENAVGTTAGTYRIFSISTGSSSFEHYMFHFNGIPAYAIINSTTQANLSAGTISANVINKYIGAYATNDAAADFNGGTVQTDNAVNLPTPTQANLGGIAGSSILGSRYIKEVAYFPTRIGNTNMQSLTT